jgi:hypothetical protein
MEENSNFAVNNVIPEREGTFFLTEDFFASAKTNFSSNRRKFSRLSNKISESFINNEEEINISNFVLKLLNAEYTNRVKASRSICATKSYSFEK